MEITDVRVRRIDREGKLKAVVSVTFDDEFVVHDLKVIESQNGLFIAMPSRKAPDGEFRDVAHPINPQMRERLHTAILQKYNDSIALATQADDSEATPVADSVAVSVE